jgi:hypothetical protein
MQITATHQKTSPDTAAAGAADQRHRNKGQGSSKGLRCVALHSSILLGIGIGTGAGILFTGTLSRAM